MIVIAIFGMFAAIAVMIIGAYRNMKPIPLTILAAIVVICTNQLEFWPALAKTYAGGYANIVAQYFFIFCASAAYGVFMQRTGSTTAIAHQIIRWFGIKNVILVSSLIVAVLTYGGISLFVVVFATQPILLLMFKEAGLPRRLILGPFFVGLGTYTLGCLPGTPQLTNVIPSQFLGTPMTAAPVFSIFLAIIMGVLCQFYLIWEEKQCRKRGEKFDFPAGFDKAQIEIDASALPNSFKAFAPIVFLVVFIIVSTMLKAPYAGDPGLLASVAMGLAIIVCIVLNTDKVNITKVKDWLGEGTVQGMSAIIGLAAVIAFGAVVASTPAFKDILQWVINLKLNIYVKGVVSTAIISGITGSSSGGIRIVMQNMADYFKASGANLQVLHRLMGVAAGSFDTLPHVSAIFLFFSMFGVTHKESYKYVFVTTVAVPAVTVTIGLIVALIVY